MNIRNTNDNAQMSIASLYARVSTSRQEKEETIESQIQEIENKAREEGFEIRVDLRFVDEGWSGEILARPQLDQLRDAIKEGRVHILYVYDLGRLSRTFLDQLILLEECKRYGVKVISLHDINAENDEQVLARNVMGLFHDYERKKIAERTRRGKLFKARAGVMINGSALYGFNYIRKTDTENARYEINDDERKAVLMAQDWFGNEQVSINEIIRRFYNLKIYPKKGKSETWTKGPMTRLLRCETYFTGVAYFNKSEAVVPLKPIKQEVYKKVKKSSRRMRPKDEWLPIKVPMINTDRDLYRRILQRLDYNKKYARKNRKYDYLLSERITCGCGQRRAGDGSSKQGHFYYRCEERLHNFPAIQRKCKIKGMNAQVLDTMFWNELKKQLLDPSMLRKHAEEWLTLQATSAFDVNEKNRLFQQLAEIGEEEKRYAKAYGTAALEFDVYREIMKEVKKRKESYQKQIAELEATVAKQTIDIGVDELMEEVKAVMDEIDLTNELLNKKQLVRDIIDNVIIQERSEVEVCGHIPLLSITTEKLGHEPISWNRWFAKRGEINSF